MAVSPEYSFDYEVILRVREGGGFEGTAESVQAREGLLPGLAGPCPVASVSGDDLRFEAPRLSVLEMLLEAFEFVVPPLFNGLRQRRSARASVRAIELSVPGLGAALRNGSVLRATLVTEASVPVQPLQAHVSVRSEHGPIRTWESRLVQKLPF
ncbi:MAG TPA: hypothetical protein VGK73_26265 [Polyangiaceae bacterium]